jgi:hypothetical protein
MHTGWKIQAEKPKFAISRLASLQAESPSNSQTDDEIGILVALWCGRENIQIDVEKTIHRFNVGFTVGELELSVKNGRISSQNRFTQEFYREKIDQNAKDTSTKEGKAGGFLGLDFSKFFSGAKFSIEGGAKIARGSVNLEEKKGNYYRVYWRVADAGYNHWKCFGHGLNEHSVLENKILGDEILCFIIPEKDNDNVEILVRYYCDLQDLWFEYEHDAGMLAKVSEKSHRNREVVASAIVARALNNSSRRDEGISGRRLVLLCQQRIIAKRHLEARDD